MHIVFIDGLNFIHHIQNAFSRERVSGFDSATYPYYELLAASLDDIDHEQMRFYVSKVASHPQAKRKSRRLQENRRSMALNVRRSGVEFVFAGIVRGRSEKDATGRRVTVFKEKGTDVRIVVDMVTLACDKKLTSATLVSSDSDFQPAITELRERGVHTRYVGFQKQPNRGLIGSTHECVLIPDWAVTSQNNVIPTGKDQR